VPTSLDYLLVNFQAIEVPADIHRTNKIADMTVHPHRIPAHLEQIDGFVRIHSLSSSQRAHVLQIPFFSRVFHGSLDYVKSETMFYIPPGIDDSSSKCQPIRLINRFRTTIALVNISKSPPEHLSKHVQVGGVDGRATSSHVTCRFTLEITRLSSDSYLRPNQLAELLCISVRNSSALSKSFSNIQVIVEIHTNLSTFNLPIHLYNGLLNVSDRRHNEPSV
jgi:hypothetical protein